MFYKYILLFFIYSILGWILEVTLSLITEKKFINRGFLIGPYCPIYGVGCLFLIWSLSKYKEDTIILLGLTLIICSILEYTTSWLMEKIFKLRWWDYTQMKFNINGRICLETMVPFSIIGVLVIKYINPFLINIINTLSKNTTIILSIILISIFIIDTMVSCNVVFNLKYATENIRKDSTEEIKKAINKFIHNNLYMYKRIINAFPNMSRVIKEKTQKTKNIVKNIKKKNQTKTRKIH